MRYLIPVVIFLFILQGPVTFCQEGDSCTLLAEGATLEKLAGGFSFTEGPAADRAGNVYFTDQPNDMILKWSIDGRLSTFMQPSGRSNGLFFSKDGFLYSCADENNEIWKININGGREKVTALFNGRPLNGPNDLWITPGGGIYFTDPYYKRPWWDHSEKPQETEAVYYLAPGKREAIRVESGLIKPNGIIGSPDGKELFVADIGGNKTYRFRIMPDGSLSDKELFCELGSDGMTIDTRGNLYLTGNGITIFDKSGKRLCNITVPERWTANVCFGDKDRKSLFITAMNGLYRIRMKTKGAW